MGLEPTQQNLDKVRPPHWSQAEKKGIMGFKWSLGDGFGFTISGKPNSEPEGIRSLDSGLQEVFKSLAVWGVQVTEVLARNHVASMVFGHS